jgi:arylsulfate sulfotransferase
MVDEIIEFQRDGTVVWRWNAFDWLDPYRMGYEALYIYWLMHGFSDYVDWTHGNGLWLDESDDSFVISLRHQDALFKIDRKTGEIKWILGEPTDWSAPLQKKLFHAENGMRWPYHTHAPSITPQGTILLFDNGNYRARPFQPPFPPNQSYSRAVEYAIDTDEMTVRQVWESDTADGDAMVTYAMGDADWLPKTNNVLVTYGFCYPRRNLTADVDWMTMNDFIYQTRIREVAHTHPPEVVWEIRMDEEDEENPTHSWQTFGSERIAGFYK